MGIQNFKFVSLISSSSEKITIYNYNNNITIKFYHFRSYSSSENHEITILDMQNKLIVFSAVLKPILAVVIEWGSFYIITKDNNVHHLVEKNVQSKLALLFKKNRYDVAIR